MTKRAKTTEYASDDHASDLLADILDATEDEARAEQARIEQDLQSRRRAKELAAAEAHATQIAARQAKLKKELERQEQLAQRRTVRMEALKAPPQTPAAPAPAEITPPLDEAAIRRQIAEEVREELRAIGITPMPAPLPEPNRPGRAGWVAAAAIAIAVGGAAVAVALSSSYRPDPTSYAKSVFAPVDRDAVALEMSSVAIPKPDPVVVAEPARATHRPRPIVARPTPREDRSVFGAPTTKTKERESYERLIGRLESSDDPFGVDEE